MNDTNILTPEEFEVLESAREMSQQSESLRAEVDKFLAEVGAR